MAQERSYPLPASMECSPVGNWCVTKTNIAETCFHWSIDHFSLRRKVLNEPITSTIFTFNNMKWCLQLYPYGIYPGKDHYVSVFLLLVDPPDAKASCYFKISILGANGQNKFKRDSCFIRDFAVRPETEVGMCRYISRKVLYNEANELLPDDTLHLCLEAQIVLDSVNVSAEQSKFQIPDCKFLQEVSGMVDDTELVDCALIVKGCEFKAHKFILAARSPVFRAMFRHNMKERNTNQVIIPDIDPDVFRSLLEFIYTGKAEDIDEMADGLLVAADKYAMLRLKVLCAEALAKQMSTENVIEILQLADMHGEADLKQEAKDFIHSHASEVRNMPSWKSLKRACPSLQEEIASSLEPPKKRQRRESPSE